MLCRKLGDCGNYLGGLKKNKIIFLPPYLLLHILNACLSRSFSCACTALFPHMLVFIDPLHQLSILNNVIETERQD